MQDYIKYSLTAITMMVASVFAGTYTPAEATGSRCLDPNSRSSYEARITTRNSGTITTSDGRPLCSQGQLVLQSFNVPDTWNKRGWNTTAIPQTQFASKSFTFPAGKSDHTMTVEVASPDVCKHTQLDFYIAPGYKSITTLEGDDELNIIGVLFQGTEKCEQPKPKEIQVCVLSDKTTKTIYEKDFDSTKQSKNLDDCKVTPKPEMIKVCVLQNKSIQTIDKKDFDISKHSKDLNDCKVTPAPELIEVCVLEGKTIKTIDKKDFDISKHSKDLNDCKVTPAPKGDDKPVVKGDGTPVAIPSTGIENVLGGIIGTSSLASAGYYYVNSRRRLHM